MSELNLNLLKYIGIGSSLAFAAAVQPGPLQAYLLNRVTFIGWRRTLPASFSPLLSDGPIALVALLILGRLSPSMQAVLRVAGGILLLYLGWSAFQQWRKGSTEQLMRKKKVPRTFLEAALVNLLNPNPYLGWSLILGPVVITAWRESPGLGIAVVVAFYITMIVMLAILIFVFSGAGLLRPRYQRYLILLSVVILAGLGVYQLVKGFGYISS
ncbi:MAG: hypothetical protein GF417_05970 [Candidatus Latescibacteria bacterium]|nr:hypothetical protein [bacterium]MBD3423964.1 hypothetical protein [Candidatus Latescibacterota bacterium]